MKDRIDLPLPFGTLAAFVVAILTVLLIAVATFRASEAREQAAEAVSHTFQVIDRVSAVESALKDLEVGQRGFLLINDENYLQVHLAAKAEIPGLFASLRQLVSDNPGQIQRIEELNNLLAEIGRASCRERVFVGV